MPTIKPNAEGGEKRTTFRPPWVKDGPPSLPAPPPAWVGKQQEPVKSVVTPNRPKLGEAKNIKISIDGEAKGGPNKTKVNNYRPGPETSRAEIGKTINKESKPQIEIKQKEPIKEVRIKTEVQEKEPQKNIEIKHNINKEPPPKEVAKKDPFGEVKLRKRSEEVRKEEPKPQPTMAAPPPPPPPPGMPPPPPPPPPSASTLPPAGFKKPPMTQEKASKIEALKSRPRRRPDWTDMMKEVETGIKLKKVKCNDRSAPVLPETKAKGQFVYDSEKQNAHNLLLREIQGGINLKKVKTNDRSKPILDGLRKFRRQMTIEEQIQKSASVADVIAVATEPDELDDIDKVRDDLQSTKQMLALELRNKEALERENKRLMARLLNLEVELEKEKMARKIQNESNGSSTVPIRTAEDDKLIAQLKEEASESAKTTKEMEDKYHKTAEELDYTRAKLESAWLRNSQLEMELKSKGSYNKPPLVKQPSSKKLAHSASNVRQEKMAPPIDESESEGSDTETEGEYEDDEVIDVSAEKSANREQRELKLLTNKLKTFKEKRVTAIKEKRNLKSQLSKLQSMLKEERKKYRLLQKEVDKMASLMKEVDDDEEQEEEEEEEDEEDDEDEETETESESEEDEGAESEGDLPEDAAMEDKVANLNRRIKNQETILQRAKKGNYLLKANIDRRQDDLNRQKEMSLGLQEDLNAVLSELG